MIRDAFDWVFFREYGWTPMATYGVFVLGKWYGTWVTRRRMMSEVGLAKRPSHPFSNHPR